MAPRFYTNFEKTTKPDLRRGGTCRVTTTEACTLDGLPRDVSTLIYPGSKPQIQRGAVFVCGFVCLWFAGGGCSTGSTLLGYLFFDVGSMDL